MKKMICRFLVLAMILTTISVPMASDVSAAETDNVVWEVVHNQAYDNLSALTSDDTNYASYQTSSATLENDSTGGKYVQMTTSTDEDPYGLKILFPDSSKVDAVKLEYKVKIVNADSSWWPISEKITPTGTGRAWALRLADGARYQIYGTDKTDISALTNTNGWFTVSHEYNNSTKVITTSFTNPEQVAQILFAQQNGKKLGYDFAENKALYECCAGIVLINSQGSDKVFDYILYAVKDDADTMEWYNKYIISDKEKAELTAKIASGIKTVDELSREIKSALILFVVENPNGYKNIREILIDFPEITGVSNLTSDTSVYSTLAGVKFENIAKLVEKYKELAGGDTSGGSSGSGSGGSGGGSSSGGKGGANIEVYGSEQSAQVLPMNKNIFTDLDIVTWAVDAIVELATKGVIAGKGDNKFCPNDMITREEFTKLVVAAFASEVNESEIMFKDVPADRWSYSYIAKAKAAGLINGYSETKFGATDLISRQDMAVIMYNSAVYKKVDVPSIDATLSFADDGKIAEYAKESVYALKAMGVINGVNDMDFAPLRNATRAEAAVIIYKLLQK